MKNNQSIIQKLPSLKSLLTVFMLIGFLPPSVAVADNVKLATKPLVDSSTSDVLPNLMFVLDNSGSMGFNYTPDWADSSDPTLRNNPTYNTQFYNPTIRYTPPVTHTGVSFPTPASWTSVRNNAFYSFDGTSSSSTNLVNNADYFSFVAGEYCTTQNLTNCVAATAPTATHPFAAPIRWCNTTGAADTILPAMPAGGACRAIREGSFTRLRTPRSSFTATFSASGNTTVSSIKINGMEIMSGAVSDNDATDLGNKVEAAIDACTSTVTGNCTVAGHSATGSATLTITSPAGAALTPVTIVKSGGIGVTASATTSSRPGSLVYTNIVSTVTSYTEPGKAAKNSGRTDCAGAVCTYNEEMTNYANWWTFYRTRMQGMKSAASLAFKGIDNRYRVGFITINSVSSNYLPIAKYEAGSGAQKDKWYDSLFSTVPSGGTPLRSALTRVGQIYAGKKPVGTSDPVEYACQSNFTLLTTDGYWNTDTAANVVNVTGGQVGNLDGGSTPKPLFEGGTATSNSLADAAKYYYDTDLRTAAFGNCTGSLGQDVCGDGIGNESIKKQVMTTLTLGLGIDGTLLYSSDYKTQPTGDFADIKAGNKVWPVPEQLRSPAVTEGPAHIDDLWHAAVNANGTYFSARDPKQLTDSLRKALSDIQSKVGTGTAASSSSLKPTQGDNFDYLASYTTVKWTGNLEARTVNTKTLETSDDAVWCVENIAAEACVAPAQPLAETVNGSSVFYCKTAGSNTTSCGALGGILSGTDCKVEVPTACTGTMATKVASNSRVIKFNSGGALTDFNYSNLNSVQKSYFETTFLSNNLTQWADLTTDSAGPPATTGQRTKAVGSGIVNYLRGNTDLEDRGSNAVENRIFRYREATLGDITESQPAFVAKSPFSYVDPGYDAFKALQETRPGTIYVGANDGMLHAFDATNGQERWAFVPTPVIPKMWKLADRDYATNHINLVNGDPTISEVCVAACTSTSATWKTILVAGLSGGGRGYYALDVTNPNSPAMMWEFTAQDYPNLGYTFGSPVITKLNDGTWVALFTSGYNNGTFDNDGVTAYSSITNGPPAGNGQGYLFVVDIRNGALIKTISTGEGTANTPSGLGQIAAYADKLIKNNLATFVYGGDLNGNLWRFDINSNAAPLKLATLKGPSGLAQPITVTPQLGAIKKQRVIFVGTGKYLELADLTNNEKQTLYGIKDTSTALGDPRGSLIPQTITIAGVTRSATTDAVDFSSGLGWYVDLPDTGERINIDPILVNGIISAPSLVPASTSCSPGGYGWSNFFNYLTGGALVPGGVISEKLNSPVVGQSLTFTEDGKPAVKLVGSSDTKSSAKILPDFAAAGNQETLGLNPDGTRGTKHIWRELIVK